MLMMMEFESSFGVLACLAFYESVAACVVVGLVRTYGPIALYEQIAGVWRGSCWRRRACHRAEVHRGDP